MTFVDQTGGIGYAFGDIWRSADATYLMSTVTPNTIDLRGGTHSQTGDIVIDEGAATTFRTTFDNLGVAASTVNGNVGQFFQSGVMRKTASSKEEFRFGVLGDADATINSNVDYLRWSTVPTIPRVYTLNISGGTPDEQPEDGTPIEFTMTLVSGAADAIIRDQGGTDIARILGLGNGGGVKVRYNAILGQWVTVGASGDGVYVVPH